MLSLDPQGTLVKFILDNWMLVTLALISGALLLAPVMQGAASAGLSAMMLFY